METIVEYSRTERLLLANQFKILAALYPDEEERYSQMREIVEKGFEYEYSCINQHVYEDTLDESQCREVYAILGMYTDLGYAYRELSDKSGIDEYSVTFPGFSGNEERSYLDYATFLTKDLNKFSGQVVKDSHGPFLQGMRRMLVEYKKYDRSDVITKDQLMSIIAEMKHPDHR